MPYTNDTEPTGSYSTDSVPTPACEYGVAKYGYSSYTDTLVNTADTEPTGSYTNDNKPS